MENRPPRVENIPAEMPKSNGNPLLEIHNFVVEIQRKEGIFLEWKDSSYHNSQNTGDKLDCNNNICT